MKVYQKLIKDIRDNGHNHDDRTGVGRRSIFGIQTRFDLNDGFPLVTTRKIFTRGMVEELLWFIRGSYDVKELQSKEVKIWDKWALTKEQIEAFAEKYSKGDQGIKEQIITAYSERIGSIGPMYGAMWRNAPQDKVHVLWPMVSQEDMPSDKIATWQKEYEEMKFFMQMKKQQDPAFPEEIPAFEEFCQFKYRETVDQLNDLLINLKQRPYSSRHVVNAWIPALVPFETVSPADNVIMERGALAPCHMAFQCFVLPPKEGSDKKRLSLMMTQRSLDVPVGGPYNIAQYALLLSMLAHVTDMEPHEFIWSVGDAHIYLDQLQFIDEQLDREPKTLPKLWLNPEVKDLFKFTVDDIRIEGYDPHPVIDYPVAT